MRSADTSCAEKQPEFSNNMLEQHKDDARCYDVIGFVDPVRRANYGSRLSHGCAPNAVSVSIAVYASRGHRLHRGGVLPLQLYHWGLAGSSGATPSASSAPPSAMASSSSTRAPSSTPR